MSTSVLSHSTLLTDHFRVDNPYIMPSPRLLSRQAVSEPWPKPQQITESTLPLERQSTVHFDEDVTLRSIIEGMKPIDRMSPKGLKPGENGSGSNRGASRSTVATTTKTAPSSTGTDEDKELTPVDKKWGTLFDDDGEATGRFKEVMKSLFQYIIKAFPASESIVLVPGKLASFYNFHSVNNDPFRYQHIFRSQGKDTNRSLAELYQDLGCSFHLVQAGPATPPRIPGLTPDGFSRWMILHVQAFPDETAHRLERAISDFPLDVTSATDGKSERLPKQLSRYLFPKSPDYHTRSLLQQALKRHFGEAALPSPVSLYGSDATEQSRSSPSSPLPASPLTSPSSPLRPNRRDIEQPTNNASPAGAEQQPARRSHGTLDSGHRRHNSYSGPVVVTYGDRDPTYEGRGRRGSHHDGRSREESRSRSRLPRHIAEHGGRLLSDDKYESRARHHRHRHSYDDRDYHSGATGNRRRSLSRSRHLSRSHIDVANAASASNDSRRTRYPPMSLLNAILHPSRSSSARSTTPTTPESTGATRKTNSSVRRASSPKVRGSRASLPEIHNTGRGQSFHEESLRDARDHTRGQYSETGRRSSYFGPFARASADMLPPLTANSPKPYETSATLNQSPAGHGKLYERSAESSRGKHREPERQGDWSLDRDRDGKRTKHRSGGDDERGGSKVRDYRDREKDYRLYGSSLPYSPLSTSPVLQYSPSAASPREDARMPKTTKTESNTKAKIVAEEPRSRRPALRPLKSLQPTVVAVDNDEDCDDGMFGRIEGEADSHHDCGGSDSDQTWDEYLRSSPSDS